MTMTEHTEAVGEIDHDEVARNRQAQLRTEMAARNIDAVILTDAVNIRYATGSRNMQIFTARNPASRYCFLPVEGDVVMFEFTGTKHLSEPRVADVIYSSRDHGINGLPVLHQ